MTSCAPRNRRECHQGGDRMATLVIPDTNVFLHFQAFHTVDWKEVVHEDDIVLVILYPVVQELDKLKRDPTVGRRAGKVLSRIEELFAEGDTATLDNGTVARLDIARPLGDVLADHQLDPGSGDDRILATVMLLKEEEPDVVLVTDDAAVRIRARSSGIRHARMPDEFKNLSSDPVAAENQKLRRELDQIRKAMPDLSAKFTAGGNHITARKVIPPKFSLSLGDVLGFTPLNRDDLPPAYKHDIAPPTPAEIEEFNKALTAMRPEIDTYYEQCFEQQRFPFCAVSIGLTLTNEGGKPAEQVKLTLSMPRGIKVVLEHDKPVKPTRPKSPLLPGKRRESDPLAEYMRNALGRQNIKDPRIFGSPLRGLMSLTPPSDAPPSRGPGCYRKTLDDGKDQTIFVRKVLSNFEMVQLAPFYAVFRRPEDMHSFGMSYSIRSHSLPTLIEGELHVVVEDETGDI